MKRIVTTCLLLFAGLMMAQQDPKAKDLLDELSEKTKSYQGIELKFDYVIENTSNDFKDVQEMKVLIKGEKYVLYMDETEIYSDGIKKWSYIKGTEVSVDLVENDGEDALKPSELLTIYEKGFKYKYAGEQELDGNKVNVIELYPEQPGEKSYSRIILFIKPGGEVNKMTIHEKSGDVINYIIKDFKERKDLVDDTFIFDISGCEQRGEDVIIMYDENN